jgi:DNA-binding Xre family transcriptional regulator
MVARFRLHKILAAREKQGETISQSELSRMADIHFATVHRLLHNQTARVDLEVLQKLADALGVKPGDLIEAGDP